MRTPAAAIGLSLFAHIALIGGIVGQSLMNKPKAPDPKEMLQVVVLPPAVEAPQTPESPSPAKEPPTVGGGIDPRASPRIVRCATRPHSRGMAAGIYLHAEK